MIKLVTASIAALLAGGVVAGSATSASAHYGSSYGHGCAHCGPIAPTFHVHTIYTHKSETLIHNKSVTVHVPRYHRIITVTRVQPIINVHKVTVVHHHTICYKKDVFSSKVEHLRPIIHTDVSFRATFDCHCH